MTVSVNFITLYVGGLPVQVIEGSQLHYIYAGLGATTQPPTAIPYVRPDPFPQYVHDEEIADLLAVAAIPATDPVVAALLGDGGSQTRAALDALDLGPDPITPEAVEANLPDRLSEAALGADFASSHSVTDRALYVGDYGTLGTADDTATIQAAVTAAKGRRLVFPGGATLNVSELLVSDHRATLLDGNGVTLALRPTGGTRRAAFRLTGTCEQVTIQNFTIQGSGLVADAHAGISNSSGQTLRDMRYLNNTILDCTLGISVSADPNQGGGTLDSVLIQGNTIRRVHGTESGFGYGIHHASSRDQEAGVRIIGNLIEDAGRHSIYQAMGKGVVIANNVIRNHRTTQIAAGGAGTIRSALMIARTYDVTAHGNSITNSAGGAVYITGSNITDNELLRHVVLADNIIAGSADAVPLVNIGQQPGNTNDGPGEGIHVTDNMITSAATELLRVYGGKRVRVSGNYFGITATTASVSCIRINGTNDTAGTANVTDDVVVDRNNFVGVGTASVFPVRLTGTETTAIKMAFTGNRHFNGGTGAGDFFVLTSALSNPNVLVADQPYTGLSFTGGATLKPRPLAGPTSTTATAGSATLPANPIGFLTIDVNGTPRKVPYFAV